MIAWAAQLLMFAGSLTLLVPPGACGSWRCAADNQPEPVVAAQPGSCCHHQQPAKTSAPESSCPLEVSCCCVRNATLPERGVAADDVLSSIYLIGLPAVNALPPLAAERSLERALQSLAAGPPLRIVHCVWRC